MAKFRKGDVVTVEAVVDMGQYPDDEVRIKFPGDQHYIYVKASSLVMRRPSISIGDSERACQARAA